ncbi:MAG: hypothetical protein A2145_02445 [candidate division Zixibacteria bacterium RBG_16_40_9]|nr:MAG: hypothetical protein A2145_02445 [candidate division Zixibacteria bacterium RBG_16_40_9]
MKPKYFYLWLLIVLSISDVWGKDPKTGTVEKNLFTDSRYNYQFTVPENWKAKAEKEPSPLRAILQKTKVERYGSATYSETQVSIPSMFICVETTSLALDDFCKLLLETPKKLPNADIYLYKMEFLTNAQVLDRMKIVVDSVDAQKIYMKKKYFKTVQDPRAPYGQEKTRVVEDFLLGFFVIFKKENNLFLIHCSCDREIFRINEQDWHRLLDSWKFFKPTSQIPQN